MKKVDLEKRIAKFARASGAEWVLIGGTNHDKYRLNGVVIMIPRHNEIGEMLAKKILRDCDKALGK